MILRPYQQAALDTLWNYLRHREGNPALVLPTGAGKSPLMAAIAREAVTAWQGRVGIIAHTKELVGQNHDKFRRMCPEIPAGIYSASLSRRDRFDPVLFLQIQSVYSRAANFGRFDLLCVDEGHRIPLKSEGTYRRFIADCQKVNPTLRVVVLTATPYRLQGRAVPICGPDHIATEIAYEARIPELIAGGYLSRLVSKSGDRPELGGVVIRGGEYVEASLAAAMLPLVERTVADILSRADGRRAGIVFCVNVAHAEAVLERLHAAGERAAMIHAGTVAGERDAAVAAFQRGALRWMVNVNVLSEGFDAPHIDCVAMLRPTKSPGLYYQQVGRGLRIADGKDDCLVLDYAGNTLEHGAIDEIRVQQPRSAGKVAQVVVGRSKECPKCATLLTLSARVCECGHQFGSADPEHLDRPVEAPVLSTERARVVNRHAVGSVAYSRHEKPGKPVSLRVTYQCGMRRFSEWVCLEHGGFARGKALAWWVQRAGAGNVPRTVEEALPLAWQLPMPAEIEVDETNKYASVIGHTFGARAAGAGEPVGDDAPDWLQAATRGIQEKAA